MLRHPAHELYDSACELLIAVQRLRSATRHPDCGQAIPATLGCLGAALDELASASTVLGDELRQASRLSVRSATPMKDTLNDLSTALIAARDVCEVARSKAAIATTGDVVPPP